MTTETIPAPNAPSDATRMALVAIGNVATKPGSRPVPSERVGELRSTILQAAREMQSIGWGAAGHVTGMTERVPYHELWANPLDPVQYTDEELAAMAANLALHGQQQPLIVVRAPDPRDEMVDGTGATFLIVDGRKRYAAAARAGLEALEVIERPFKSFYDVMLETVNGRTSRHHFTDLEIGRMILRLRVVWETARKNDKRLPDFPRQQALAAMLGTSQSTVSRWTSLVELPEQPLNLLDRGDLTEAQARELLPLDARRQTRLAQEIARDNHAALAVGGAPIRRDEVRRRVQATLASVTSAGGPAADPLDIRTPRQGVLPSAPVPAPADVWLTDLVTLSAPVAVGYLAHDLAAWLEATLAMQRASGERPAPALLALQRALTAPEIVAHIATLQPPQ